MCVHPQPVQSSSQTLADRLVSSTTAALEILSIYLGKRLGLYSALAALEVATSAELAQDARTAERYTREWLEQQAVAGLLHAHEATDATGARRFSLPAGHRAVLLDADDPAHVAPLAEMVAGIGGALEEVVGAYRSGQGVPYPSYGASFRAGQAGINRPAFRHDLVGSWVAAMPEVEAALRRPGVRVADVGCGGGWSTIALAKAFPQATVIGYDADLASVEDARRNADREGSSATFEVRDVLALADERPFDVVFLIEALHDMARPGAALMALRKALTNGGNLIVIDERVADHFHAPGDAMERLMYGWSVLHCLPVAMWEGDPDEAIGTVIRRDIVSTLAQRAGFGGVETLPVEAGFFRIHRLSV